ncbi:MAG: hypothetical protein P8J14_06390 [Emcibacteraceae bacterium]|nr:hypothetical protein [Emcibacteraceae bacterium]
MYKEDISNSMLTAAMIVKDFYDGNIALAEMVLKYDNCYHFQALDGHEASVEQLNVLDELKAVVDFHAEIQMNVLDKVYFDDDYENNDRFKNRLSSSQAIDEIKNICEKNDLGNLILFLEIQLQ